MAATIKMAEKLNFRVSDIYPFLRRVFYFGLILIRHISFEKSILSDLRWRLKIERGTFHVKTPKYDTFFHHGSENLNQIFLMDSPINLMCRFILAKLSKMKTRIIAAY
jgi:hypothetical protein